MIQFASITPSLEPSRLRFYGLNWACIKLDIHVFPCVHGQFDTLYKQLLYIKRIATLSTKKRIIVILQPNVIILSKNGIKKKET